MNGAELVANGRIYEQMAVGWLADHGITAEAPREIRQGEDGLRAAKE